MELFVAIAMLCGNPSQYRLGESDVIECQKYFTQCVIEKNKSPNSALYKLTDKEYVLNALSRCILERTKWEGK